jgi:hypothetical protein
MTTYTPEQLASFPWIISCDTLRTEDLLVKFWGAAEQIGADLTDLLPDLQRLVGEDSSESDWNDEQAGWALESLAACLQDAAPTGFYFGASEGDGACFGFWLTPQWCDALEVLSFGNDDPTGWAELVARLEADGLDPDNIEDAYQGRAEGWSEERAGADYAQQLAEELSPSFELDRTGSIPWPHRHVDWDAAWRELQTGDGYRLHDIGGGEWLVFRSV